MERLPYVAKIEYDESALGGALRLTVREHNGTLIATELVHLPGEVLTELHAAKLQLIENVQEIFRAHLARLLKVTL